MTQNNLNESSDTASEHTQIQEDDRDKEPTQGNTFQPQLKRPYDNLVTDLSEDDLKSPGVQKLILSKSNELEVENYKLKEENDLYRKLEVKFATISSELTNLKASQRTIASLHSICLGAGTCLIGVSLSIGEKTLLNGSLVGGVGLLLTGTAIWTTMSNTSGAKETIK